MGIVATLFIVLYFSRKQMQSLSMDFGRNTNDLDEKINGLTGMRRHSPESIKVVSKPESHRVRKWFDPAFEGFINKEIIHAGRN